MAIYSIKDLEKLCGIKAHTIRIWESRYQIIAPQRTKSNIRYYKEEDLKFLLNVAFLNKNGFKISKIAKMTKEDINAEIAKISSIETNEEIQLDTLTLSMLEMDEFKFNLIISANIKQLGFERTMIEIIYPFMDKLSLLWLTGAINQVQEIFITGLVRQKIIAAIDLLPPIPIEKSKKIVIYLPEGETQDLSLLLTQYLAKNRQIASTYLNTGVSLKVLSDIKKNCYPDYIFTFISETYTKTPVKTYVNQLSNIFPESKIIISGYQVYLQQIQNSGNTTIVNSLTDIINYLDEIKNQ